MHVVRVGGENPCVTRKARRILERHVQNLDRHLHVCHREKDYQERIVMTVMTVIRGRAGAAVGDA